MNERHLQAEEAEPGRLVDQLRALSPQAVELGGDVGDLEGDVVEPGPAAREEPADRRFRAERVKKLDTRAADTERGGLDALVGDGLAMLERRAEERGVRGDRRVQVLDRDPDVVNPADGPQATPSDPRRGRE